MTLGVSFGQTRFWKQNPHRTRQHIEHRQCGVQVRGDVNACRGWIRVGFGVGVEDALKEFSRGHSDDTEAGLGAVEVDAELDFLSAVANKTRYTLVRVLVAAQEEHCVCELNAVVDVSESSLSHALSKLVDAGLVDGRKDSRWKNIVQLTVQRHS